MTDADVIQAAVEMEIDPYRVAVLVRIELWQRLGRSRPGVFFDQIHVFWIGFEESLLWSIGSYGSAIDSTALLLYVGFLRDEIITTDKPNKAMAVMIAEAIQRKLKKAEPE